MNSNNIFDYIVETSKSIRKIRTYETKQYPQVIEDIQHDLSGVAFTSDVIDVMQTYIDKAKRYGDSS